ncbi:hypothetical protein CDAR_414771 [Caerostris darwini]|uniref:Uncharacterized protein n=1 Tax=Caerostris darwini TaxID=1538125 RepID=A0AAV4RGE6_9ARAC|nr:hypothetical protein CDAR_414771 [Caerostris darwini]
MEERGNSRMTNNLLWKNVEILECPRIYYGRIRRIKNLRGNSLSFLDDNSPSDFKRPDGTYFLCLEKPTILSSDDLRHSANCPSDNSTTMHLHVAVGRTVVEPIRKPHIRVNSSPLVELLRTPFPRSPQILDAH